MKNGLPLLRQPLYVVTTEGHTSNNLQEEINMAERVLKPIILSGVQEDQID